MSNFFRALKRAADRLDKTAGFDTPLGTRPYRSVGDVLGEVKNILTALDDDAGLNPREAQARRELAQRYQYRIERGDDINEVYADLARAFQKSLNGGR